MYVGLGTSGYIVIVYLHGDNHLLFFSKLILKHFSEDNIGRANLEDLVGIILYFIFQKIGTY